uniref:Variant surface glycoprotein 1125.1226 n=1 Tax=Trypanosoma brucei TaxID=5691 RepID=A0A1J0R6J5_9TRYP|nr:variant surface glycoprotein 1125.1226 [Trypanosoma brucei]
MKPVQHGAICTTVNLFALVLLTRLNCASAAKPDAGLNAAHFLALCKAVRVAKSTLPTPAAGANLEDLSTVAAAVAVSLSDHKEIVVKAEKQENKGPVFPAGSSENTTCSAYSWPFCKRGAEYLKTNNKNFEIQTWLSENKSPSITRKLNTTLATFLKTMAGRKQIQLDQTVRKINGLLNDALEGEGSEKTSTNLSGSPNRETACGKISGTTKTAGTLAGKSLKADIMCLCAMEPSGDKEPAVCTTAKPALSVENSGAKDLQPDWEILKKACGTPVSKEGLTTAHLTSLTEDLTQLIMTGKGENNKHPNVLGALNNGGETSCNGNANAQYGVCVIYETEAGTNQAKNLKWMAVLKAEATTLAQLNEQRKQENSLKIALVALNTTLANIATGEEPLNQQNIQQTDADDSSKQLAAKIQKCNEAKDDQEACKKLEDKGCVFNPKGEKDKKCTLSE